MTPTKKDNYDDYTPDNWDTVSEHRTFAIAAGLRLLHRLAKATEDISYHLARIERRLSK